MSRVPQHMKFTWRTLILFLVSPFAIPLFRFVVTFVREYMLRQYRGPNPVDVSLPVDWKIPERPHVATYFNIFFFPLALLVFAQQHFSDDTVAQLVRGVAELDIMYRLTCPMFSEVQTTFRRPRTCNIALNVLRLVDRNRNCYPSLHAQSLAKVYFIVAAPLNAQGAEELREAAFCEVIAILEACLVTKQHSVRDIAAGLAALAIDEPTFEVVGIQMIKSIFKRTSYIPATLKAEIEGVMLEVYERITTTAKSEGVRYPEVLVREVRRMS